MVFKNIFNGNYGDLVYQSFTKEKEDDDYDNIQDWLFQSTPKFEVEPVSIQTPTTPDVPTTTIETPTVQPTPKTTESVETRIVIPGTATYARRNIDVGKMQDWIDLATKEGISFTVYSGVRPNAMAKSGHKSNHSIGMALDIGPGKGQTFDDLKRQILASPKLVAFMKEKGIGIINETIPEIMRQTGATGPHFHVGPDQWGLQHFERWLRNEKENLHKL